MKKLKDHEMKMIYMARNKKKKCKKKYDGKEYKKEEMKGEK